MKKEKLYEQLAAIEHERWADWQRYMHNQCLDRVIPKDLFERWERQINTTYAELSEAEKQSDREQVDRYWHLIGSDGFHTFDELYEHRYTLFIALCKVAMMVGEDNEYSALPDYDVWRSKLHSDGSNYDGWFILGINKEKGRQMTYHLPLSRWDDTDFAETLDKAPEYDGHTSADVLKRLKEL